MDIGKTLKYYRKLHCLTQSEVAELSGINEKYLGRIERNESVPTVDKIEQLCVAFDIRLKDFLAIDPMKIIDKSHLNSKCSKKLESHIVFYCNCCGCSFSSDMRYSEDDIKCPDCGCVFDEDNNFIEVHRVYNEKID